MANKQLKRWLPSTGQLRVRAERSTRSQTHRTRALPAGVTLAQLPETAGQLFSERGQSDAQQTPPLRHYRRPASAGVRRTKGALERVVCNRKELKRPSERGERKWGENTDVEHSS